LNVTPKTLICLLFGLLLLASQCIWLIDHGSDGNVLLRLGLAPVALAGLLWLGISVYERLCRRVFWAGLPGLVRPLARPRYLALLICAFTLMAYLGSMGGHFYSIDDGFRFRGTRAIVDKGNLILYHMQDGSPHYCKYGITHLVFAIPLYIIGKQFNEPGGPMEKFDETLGSTLMQLVGAAAALVLFLTFLELGYSRNVAVASTLAVAFCGLAWPYAKHFFTEPLTSFLLLTSFWLLLRFKNGAKAHNLIWSSLALGLAGMNTPIVFGLAAPLFGLYFIHAVWPRQDGLSQSFGNSLKLLIVFVLPATLCLAGQLGLNQYRYDSPFLTGYEGDHGFPTIIYDGSPGWSIPWWVGVQGFLFTPGKSVFLFSPPLILAALAWRKFGQRRIAELLLISGLCLAWLAFYAKWWAWHGDASWGPRYMVPLVALASLPLAEALSWWQSRGRGFKITVLAILALGLGVQILGIYVPFGEYFGRTVNLKDYSNQYLLHYVPHFSPIMGHIGLIMKGFKPDFYLLGGSLMNIILIGMAATLGLLLAALGTVKGREST
jgi:uncharacterized protein (DUF3820 family)